DAGGVTQTFKVDKDGDATIAGDLTVSGAGTSSFGGDVLVKGDEIKRDVDNDLLQVFGGSGLTDGAELILIGESRASSPGYAVIRYGGTPGTGDLSSEFQVEYRADDSSLTTTFSVDSSGDATIAGDLTVSGTGNSAFSGTISTPDFATIANGINLPNRGTGTSHVVQFTTTDHDTLWIYNYNGDFRFWNNTDTFEPALLDGDTGDLTIAGDLIANGGKVTVGSGSTAGTLYLEGGANGDWEVRNDGSDNLFFDYAGTNKAYLTSGGLLQIDGDLRVDGDNILGSGGTTVLTFSSADVTIAGDLTVSGNDIKSTSATALTLSGADVTIAGDAYVSGRDIYLGTSGAVTSTITDSANASYTRIDPQNDMLILYDESNAQSFRAYQDGSHYIEMVGGNTNNYIRTGGAGSILNVGSTSFVTNLYGSSITIDDGTESGDLLTMLNFGTDNAEYARTSYIGCQSSSALTVTSLGGLTNGSSTDSTAWFLLHRPYNKGGDADRDLFVKGVQFQIADADASNYVDTVTVYGRSATLALTQIHQETTNFTTTGNKAISITATNVSSYYDVVVSVAFVVGTVSALEFNNPQVLSYYT
ncbi:MAG: hypothetical protein ACTSPB_22945, partial [Candidatus Thorarchaeota archaeon]